MPLSSYARIPAGHDFRLGSSGGFDSLAQISNLGYCGTGPVVALTLRIGFVLGGCCGSKSGGWVGLGNHSED